MMRARQLGALLLLAHVAFAQTATNIPAAPMVTNISVSGQDAEVRINVSATAVVSAARVTSVYAYRIAIDLPGVVYNMSARRIMVNKNGVRAVRIWQQSENPPLTRMLIELEQATPYQLSTEGNNVVLRIGAHVQEQVQRASIEPAQPAKHQEVAATPTGRTSHAVSAAEAVIGVFHRGEKAATYSKTEDAPPVLPAQEPLPPLQISQAQEPSAPKEDSIEKAVRAVAVRTEIPAPKTMEEPIVAQSPVPDASASPASELSTNSSSVAPSILTSAKPVTPPTPEPATSAPAAAPIEVPAPTPPPANVAPVVVAPEAPASSVAAVKPPKPARDSSELVASSSSVAPSIPPSVSPVPPPAPEPATPAPVAAPIDVPVPAPPPAIVAPTAAPPEESVSVAMAVEPSKPARAISEPDMRTVTESVNTGMRTAFEVKHVQDETVYLDGGRSSGLAEGMTLIVKGDDIAKKDEGKDDKETAAAGSTGDTGGTVAELAVIGVAETSAVAEIHSPKREILPGDVAFLSSQDTQALVDQHTMGATRKYPAVITFTESDLLDNEARAFVPRPPLPSVNRMRGLIGIDYMDTVNRDSSQSRSSEIGGVFRADFTRIGGTFWNLSGYWRGRINSFSSSAQPTLQDLLNRTYHLDLTYQNPGSHWVAGVGRMYLPWASSLSTIDGGYFGRRLSKIATIGIFGGSTPDPTSWNYNPDQKIGGTFVNFQGGSYEKLHYASTSGLGVNLLKWQMQNPFLFFENSITYKQRFSIYHSMQADRPKGNPAVPSPGAEISQSFLTVRFAPVQRLDFSINDTYFRNIPTFDPTLIGTGLLDKYLFQGVSAGVRVEIVKQVSLYTDLGESSRTGDAKRSLNQLYGIAFGKVPWLGLHADAHYSKFNSSFAAGTYRAVSLSRTFGDSIHVNLLAGDQSVVSSLAGNQTARFITAMADTSLGARFFLQGGLTLYRGQLQNYNQVSFTLGYRFDSKGKHR